MSAVNWTSGKGGKILTLVFFVLIPFHPLATLNYGQLKNMGLQGPQNKWLVSRVNLSIPLTTFPANQPTRKSTPARQEATVHEEHTFLMSHLGNHCRSRGIFNFFFFPRVL